MGLCDVILMRIVKILTIFSIFLFAANSYLQLRINKDPLESAFSVAVFLTAMISIASVTYSNSLSGGSEKEKARNVKIIAGIFALVGVGFLIRVWMIIPTERSWVVPASCAVPAAATLAFLVFHRRLSGAEVGK